MFCRICKSEKLVKFLDLGFTAPADQFLRKEQLLESEVHYPLEVMSCQQCGLVQLGYIVSPEVLYRRDYPYESSITAAGQVHWNEFAATVATRYGVKPEYLVVDIGSNVGVLLEAFKRQGFSILGVEPASNIVRLAEKRGIPTINEFFSSDVAQQIVAISGKAQVITATNVFAHVDELDKFMEAINILLDDSGIFIVEAPYLLNLLNHLEYDTIYHEHLSYLSLKPMQYLFARFQMDVIHVEERDIHGGSFRVYVSRKGRHHISNETHEFQKREEQSGCTALPELFKFARAVEKNREELVWLLHSLQHEGKKIAAVSAPAKGMTLLQYCRLGPEIIHFVTEKSTLKIGRFTPGMHIPVVPDAKLIEEMPDYALLLAWNFAEEIMHNLVAYKEKGGKFILPIPTPHIFK